MAKISKREERRVRRRRVEEIKNELVLVVASGYIRRYYKDRPIRTFLSERLRIRDPELWERALWRSRIELAQHQYSYDDWMRNCGALDKTRTFK